MWGVPVKLKFGKIDSGSNDRGQKEKAQGWRKSPFSSGRKSTDKDNR